MGKPSNRRLPLGTDLETGEPINLGLARLSEHVDITGPTGCGKTQGVMLPIFEALAPMPDVSVVAMTGKGDFCTMCSDFMIGHGLTNKLVVFKPGLEPLVGFNPLQKNGWPAERHAKIARTAVLASRGEHSLDEMPQLSRLLYLSLAVALEQGLSLVEAARLLRPGRSPFRSRMLRTVQSEFLRESLEWFDGLKDGRQEELAASSLARLENFTNDPLIRSILTEQESCLDIRDIIGNHKKLCIDLGFYNPLVPDDARTMGRLILNNILAHKFATPKAERSPTVLLIDEVQEFGTEDMAVALTLGRELQLYVVMAHQFPSQLKLGATDSHLFEAVQECCRTKIVFGGMHVRELKEVVEEFMIGEFDPYFVKDEQKTLILEPVETTRDVVTRGRTIGGSLGMNTGTSSATARGRSRSVSRQSGTSEGHGDSFSMAHATGIAIPLGPSESLLPSGDIITVTNPGGTSDTTVSGEAFSDTYGSFESRGTSNTASTTESNGRQTGFNASLSGNVTESRSTVPFHDQIKHWGSSRTFRTLEEFLTVCLQKFKALPRGHFVIKVPDRKAVFVRAHFIRVPWVGHAMRARALQRISESLAGGVPKPINPPTPSQVSVSQVTLSETLPTQEWE